MRVGPPPIAVWAFGNTRFMNTDNAHLLCLDARSGNLLWDVAYADWNKNYGATTPHSSSTEKSWSELPAEMTVCVALSQRTTPSLEISLALLDHSSPGEPGSKVGPATCICTVAAQPGCPHLRSRVKHSLLGRHNASPDFNGDVRPGDDLYTAACSLSIPTPQTKWHFQFTPHDLYDYDATKPAFSLTRSTKAYRENSWSKQIAMALSTSSIASPENFLSQRVSAEKLNWTKGIDEKAVRS